MGLLEGKTALVLGVANRFSIAWAIAQAMDREGARLILTYQGERVEKSVRQLAESLLNVEVLPCDVEDDRQVDELFATIDSRGTGLDALIHAVAYAPSEALDGRYIETSREAFHIALGVSAYSLTAVLQRAEPLMKVNGGSVVTLSYLGGERVFPNYNVMGVAKAALEMSVRYLAADLGPSNIRVNTISAGPISTASARAVKGLSIMIHHVTETAPLRRATVTSEVADTAVYLCSDLARGVTGETIHVDSGYHVLGMV